MDADYSQIELRILAHITGDEHMQEAFRSGQDIHRSTAAKIYGIPLEEVTPRLRTAAKAINFGIMYGKGAFSLSEDLGVSMREAGSFLKNYLDSFPKVDGYMEKTIADAKEKGLRQHPVRAAAGPARAVQLQLCSPHQRGADGPQHPHSGHRSRRPSSWPW